MKNQYSFRLTTTVLPTDLGSSHPAKTTQVINKVDSDGNKFYPNFTEETVVITNDDRTIMETTRATCTDGVLTFVKRGLSDDSSATQIANRKLTWNPGSICFVTAGASDWIDRDDDMVWAGKQTYSGDAEYRGKATYKGRLITEKGVEYPHFDSLEELQAYSSPFGGMFAVVDSDGELYRYNAETETWSVVTTSTPVQPAKASEEAIGTVRVATDAEFAAGTEQGENDEYLMATIPQIKANIPQNTLHVTSVNSHSESIHAGETKTLSFEVPHPGFICVTNNWIFRSSASPKRINVIQASSTGGPVVHMNFPGIPEITHDLALDSSECYAVPAGTFTLTGYFRDTYSGDLTFMLWIDEYFYFG